MMAALVYAEDPADYGFANQPPARLESGTGLPITKVFSNTTSYDTAVAPAVCRRTSKSQN